MVKLRQKNPDVIQRPLSVDVFSPPCQTLAILILQPNQRERRLNLSGTPLLSSNLLFLGRLRSRPINGPSSTVKRGNLGKKSCLFTRGFEERLQLPAVSTYRTLRELQHLSEACRPATFGLSPENVYDESYRKALQMDTSDFATKFTVTDSRLMDVVRSELLEGHESKKAINAELYKSNGYGEACHNYVTCVYLKYCSGQGAFF